MSHPHEAEILKKVNRKKIAKFAKLLGPGGKKLLESRLSKKGHSKEFINEVQAMGENPPKQE